MMNRVFVFVAIVVVVVTACGAPYNNLKARRADSESPPRCVVVEDGGWATHSLGMYCRKDE